MTRTIIEPCPRLGWREWLWLGLALPVLLPLLAVAFVFLLSWQHVALLFEEPRPR